MNYHSDEWVMEQIQRHYNEALKYYHPDRIVGVFCQGSTNYGLDTINSDIDTKCIITPTFEEIAMNKKPVSTTHILDNNEHLDAKDIRLYIQTFAKQNLNFLEILFTPYKIINPLYESEWNKLIANREAIARMNPYRGVKSMKGIALEKYFAMEHRYPSKAAIIDAYGYDGKQVSHLIRVYDYLYRYIQGESYESCLHPTEKYVSRIIEYKMLDRIPLECARIEAELYKDLAEKLEKEYCEGRKEEEDSYCRSLLNEVQFGIMKIAIKAEEDLWL